MFIGIYLAAIVAANLLVTQFGPASSIYIAFVFIGADLTVRDKLHDQWHGRQLLPKMAGLIVAGSLISWLLNAQAGPIALASFLAFAGAASADALVYQSLARFDWFKRANGSNLAGAAVDSLVFPVIAFGGFPMLIIAGQFVAKVAGGLVWSWLLARKPRPVFES